MKEYLKKYGIPVGVVVLALALLIMVSAAAQHTMMWVRIPASFSRLLRS